MKEAMGVFTSKPEKQTSKPNKMDILYSEAENDNNLFLDSIMKKIEAYVDKKSNWKVVKNKTLECFYPIEECDREKLRKCNYMKRKFAERLKKFMISIGVEVVYPVNTIFGTQFRDNDVYEYLKPVGCKFRYIVR